VVRRDGRRQARQTDDDGRDDLGPAGTGSLGSGGHVIRRNAVMNQTPQNSRKITTNDARILVWNSHA
jgi:hypothetical protein